MHIEKITLSKEELAQAVQEFLYNRFDLNIKVESVAKDYSYSADYTINIKEPEINIATDPTEELPVSALQPTTDDLKTGEAHL
jgi:hypothetical protein